MRFIIRDLSKLFFGFIFILGSALHSGCESVPQKAESDERAKTTQAATPEELPVYGPAPVPRLSPELEQLKREIKQEFKEDVKEILVSQIIPEMQALSPVPPKARERQDSANKLAQPKPVLGRIEWVTFEDPQFKIRAKVDTGARTSSLHAENIKEKMVGGEKYVEFETLASDGSRILLIEKVGAEVVVRSSTGEQTKRYVVAKKVTLGGQTHETNINLHDRSRMRYKMLIGRALLLGNYIVDVSQSQIMGQ